MNKKNVLITGASGGIGEAFAHIAARKGNNVILVSRSADKLKDVAKDLVATYGVEAHVIPADLTDYEATEKMYITAQKICKIDMIINNAGFGDAHTFAESDPAKNKGMIDLNVTALTRLSQLAAIDMKKNGGGHIVNIASIAAFFPGPKMAVYYATKAYVLNFSEAISVSLAPYNIDVTCICPGATRSDFENKAKLSGKGIFNSKRDLPTAEELAEFGWKAIQQKKVVAVHRFRNQLLTHLIRRILPRSAIRSLVKKAS